MQHMGLRGNHLTFKLQYLVAVMGPLCSPGGSGHVPSCVLTKDILDLPVQRLGKLRMGSLCLLSMSDLPTWILSLR